MRSKAGFTLAELLIALVILGVIATFTIPKVLQSQADTKYKANAKEVMSTLSSIVYMEKMKGATSLPMSTVVQNLNYIKIDTLSWPDAHVGTAPGTGWACNSGKECVSLHNGGLLWYTPTDIIDFTDPNSVTQVLFDPDGKYTGNNDSLAFLLYSNGKVQTFDDEGVCSTCDPAWWGGGWW